LHCFFVIEVLVIQPDIRWPLLSIPLDALIAFNMVGQYYLACSTPPGFVDDLPRAEGSGVFWARRRRRQRSAQSDGGMDLGSGAAVGVTWSSAPRMTRATVTRCRKCAQLRPERAHHCRICNHCVLKYDHHCPWINQCVGVYNERHFVLFMAYLVLSTFFFAVLGYDKIWLAMGFSYEAWPYVVPAFAFALLYMLAVVMCFAVGVMLSWHVWSVCRAETSVESHDYGVYRKLAKDRGQDFENSYDLGVRQNLVLFFNIGEDGYPLYTLLLPLRTLPYTDGRSWARRDGYDTHRGLQPGEELTDDDEDDEP